MQIVLSESDKKYVRSAGYAMGAILLALAGALLFVDKTLSPQTSLTCGGLASLLSVFIWWIANGQEKLFYDDVDPDDSVGGNPNKPLDGSLSGIKH